MSPLVVDWKKRREEWDYRAQMFGKRAVFNFCHKEDELDAVTQMQKDAILPHFRAALRGDERTVLDFGCGWGRWTKILADEIKGQAVGVDPTPFFLEEARKAKAPNVDFRAYIDGRIPCKDASADVVWACLVLSTVLDDAMLAVTLAEVRRVLKKGGLMFLVDNTEGKGGHPVVSRWSISRPVEDYQAHFASFVRLEKVGDYVDLGETNSILVGRKHA